MFGLTGMCLVLAIGVIFLVDVWMAYREDQPARDAVDVSRRGILVGIAAGAVALREFVADPLGIAAMDWTELFGVVGEPLTVADCEHAKRLLLDEPWGQPAPIILSPQAREDLLACMGAEETWKA